MNATYHLLDAFCKQGGEHALVAGTCAEYDWRFGYCDEELTPCNPTTLYGIAKDATRRMCQLLASRHHIPLAWGRIFYPFGPGEGKRRLIPSLFNAFRHEIKPFGVNGNFIRDLIYIDDLVEAIYFCAKHQFNGNINLCSGEAIALKEIVEIIAKLNNVNPALILDREPPSRAEPNILAGNHCKLSSLGWKQQFDVATALSNYYRNY
jgi:nucleoside-diphosphate-sugar epimerase